MVSMFPHQPVKSYKETCECIQLGVDHITSTQPTCFIHFIRWIGCFATVAKNPDTDPDTVVIAISGSMFRYSVPLVNERLTAECFPLDTKNKEHVTKQNKANSGEEGHCYT